MKQVKAPKLPKAPKAPKMPGVSRKKKKKAGHNHKYFLFLIAAFVAVGVVGWQFKADANPEFQVSPVIAKKVRTNYVELKHR